MLIRIMSLCLVLLSMPTWADSLFAPNKGELLYSNGLTSATELANWRMEGAGELTFNEGWMQMYSPDEQGHHVLWCPHDFPDAFIAQWQVQNLKFDAGLVIVFFAAQGAGGEDIFDPNLPARDGTFTQYTLGEINSYHISYYANAAHNPDRAHANLRKNNTFSLLQEGEKGIPTLSDRVHTLTLIKNAQHIQMYIDERKIIDYTDNQAVVDGLNIGKPLGAGKMGFRQMQWTKFQYRDFKVWALAQNVK
ncbi:MAG: YesU family protein [Paraglaciecola sp.]|nr:YesU family protein [Paraglaciecola sp.]